MNEEDNIISPAATFRALTRIEAKQDLILERYDALKEDHSVLKEDNKRTEDRLSRLERRQNYWAGGLTVFIGFISFFGTKIKEVIFG